MILRSTFCIAAALSCACSMLASPAQGQFEEMVRHVPESANAIILVNIKKLLDSPMARQEGWREDSLKRFTAGLINIPPDANQLIISAQIDFRTMRPVWEMAIIQMDSVPPLSAIARQYGGVVDTVADTPALRLTDDSYVVRFSDQCLGSFAPDNRQAVSRWIRGSGDRLSPYLQEAVGYATAGAELIMALDMNDLAAFEDIQQGINNLDSELLKNANVDVAEAARLFQGVRGLMLGIKFDKRAFGKIKLDFGNNVSLLSGIAKPLLMAIVADRGLMIDEFEKWKAEVEGNRVMFGGYLNSSGLTRLSSLVELPTPALCSLGEVRKVGESARALNSLGEIPTAGESQRAPEISPPMVPKVSESGPSLGMPAGVTSPAAVLQSKQSGQSDGQRAPDVIPPRVAASPTTGPSQALPTGDISRRSIPETPGLASPGIDPSYLGPIIQSTQQYFRSTGHLVNDLRGRGRNAKSVGQIGQWYENYARKIDRLPLLYVDDQMLGYGAGVANQLRKASMAIKEAGIRSRVGQVIGVNRSRTGTARERTAIRTEVRAREYAGAAGSVKQVELEIDSATAEIRIVMTQKYQAEF